jgi:hypothetical protein
MKYLKTLLGLACWRTVLFIATLTIVLILFSLHQTQELSNASASALQEAEKLRIKTILLTR